MKSVGYNSWNSWIALLATVIIGFFSVLPMRLAGIFFIVIRERYDTDREFATVPIVFFGVLRTLLGPFTGYLGERFGCRSITLIGCILTAIGMGSCYFAESAFACIISFGFVAGIGFAFAHTLLPTILRQHFNKNFNMINGINMAGCCLGAVVMSPVVQYLVDEYGASGMFLILAAIVLNCVPACIVLKNPKNEEIKLVSKPKEHEKPVPDVSIISETKTHFENLGFVSDEGKQNGKLQSVRISVIDERMKTNTNDNSIEDIPNVKDHEFCIDQNEKNVSTLSKLNNSEQVHYFPIEKKQKDFQRSSNVELVRFSEKIKFEEHAPNKDNDSELCRTEYEIECKNQNELKAVNKNTPKANIKKPVSWQLKHLFTDPAFYCIMIVNSLHAFVNTLNWAVIMDFGIDKGIHPDLSLYFVMFLPVAEMIGNLSLNWVVDRKFMTRANYAALCFVILGLDSEFIEWSYNFILTLIAVMIYGFVAGAVRSTFPGMIYDSIDKDKQSMAMASRGLPYGLLCFAKAPVVGYFRGTLGSYKGVYYLLMAFSFVSAFFSFLTPVVKSFVDKRKKIPNE